MMIFAQPNWSYAYIFLSVFVFFLYRMIKRKQELREKFAGKKLSAALVVSLSSKKRKIKFILFFCFFVLSIFSLMRPQWGFHWQETKQQGISFLIALDVSKSMLSEDIKPNRLERSKLAIGDLIKKLTGDRIGLILFTSRAFLQCPLTSDYGGFLMTLKPINVNTMPRGGTSMAGAMKEAVEVFKGNPCKDKILIIITDGENLEGDPLCVAQDAKKAGIIIYCIGVGTTQGDLIPVIDQEGKKSFLKDKEGHVVKSRLDEKLLENIALMTGGGYVHSVPTEFGLVKIYDDKIKKFEKGEFKNKKIKIYEDRFQIFLGLALICLILEFFIDEKVK